jgi:transcriptional regulator with XRE-family HTH domain
MKMRMKSQEDVAIACGVSQATVSGWVRGSRRAPLDLLHELAEVLHLSEAEQARLSFAACEGYTPRLVWERLVELEQEVDRLHRMSAEIAAHEQLLAAEVAAIAPQPPEDGQVDP